MEESARLKHNNELIKMEADQLEKATTELERFAVMEVYEDHMAKVGTGYCGC